MADHRSTVVIGDLTVRGRLCFIGEAPGKHEDEQGRPFVGRSGKLLDKMLAKIGISRPEVSVLNIVKCRPPNNRTPSNSEMSFCGDKWLIPQIGILQPSMIVTLGNVPLRFFFPNAKMTASKGKPMFHKELEVTIFPLFHPSYILRNGNNLVKGYENDFRLMLKLHQMSGGQSPAAFASQNEPEIEPHELDQDHQRLSLDDFFD